METETVKVSDIKKLIATAHATLCVVLHALNTKILIGEINHPEAPSEKKPRKRRTKKEIALTATAGHIKMKLEKEYQAGRTSPSLSEANRIGNLPEDKDPFFAKAKPKKKQEKKIDGGE